MAAVGVEPDLHPRAVGCARRWVGDPPTDEVFGLDVGGDNSHDVDHVDGGLVQQGDGLYHIDGGFVQQGDGLHTHHIDHIDHIDGGFVQQGDGLYHIGGVQNEGAGR